MGLGLLCNVSPRVPNMKPATMTKTQAQQAAAKDPNLESLSSGSGVVIVKSSFRTDIAYARKGTNQILRAASKAVGKTLYVTSALGTQSGPHQTKNPSWSHCNGSNPKIDIRPVDVKKLNETGLFSRINGEGDHYDLQIKPEVYEDLAKGKSIEFIMNKYKGKTGQLTGRF